MTEGGRTMEDRPDESLGRSVVQHPVESRGCETVPRETHGLSRRLRHPVLRIGWFLFTSFKTT